MQRKRYCIISVLMQITYFRFLPDVDNLLYPLLLFYHLQGVHAFLIDESADLEYLSLKLCCNQYKSGIGYMCVILRYGLSVFVCVCFVFQRVGLGLITVKYMFPRCLKFPVCVLLEILF